MRNRVTQYALLTSATAILLSSVAASAQDAAPVQTNPEASPADEQDGQRTEQDIVVTGSRIRGVAPVGSSVIAVDRDQMLSSGVTTTSEVLKQVTQITSIGFNAEGSTGPAAASNITRATAPNLRGIGPTATLTVLDGNRVPASGTQGQLVDPSFLPPLALERVEVIADGASAIYGSDAVAGVINLVPRKNFTGLELTARAAVGKSYGDVQIGGIAGTNWSSGRLVAAVDYVQNGAVDASDRDFISNDRRRFGGANGLDTNCASPGTATIGGVTYALPGGNGQGVRRSQLTPGTSNTCDTARLNRLIPASSRLSIYAYADQEIAGSFKAFAQGFVSRRRFETFRINPFLTNVTVPVTNPFRPADVPAATPVQVSYSLVGDIGRGPSFGEAKTYQASAGIEGNAGPVRLRLSGSYGEGTDVEDRVSVNQFYLNQALADSNPATALNLFGGPGSNNPATLARIFSANTYIRGKSSLRTAELNADGPLFDLPGGAVRFAAGGEYREEDLFSDSVSIVAATGLGRLITTANSRSVRAVYGELFVPIFGAGNATPGIERLELSAALRHEDYSDFGKTTNPKIGLNWEPIAGLLLRGSYGTSFRAPGLSENDPTASGAGIYTGTLTLANGTRVTQVSLAGGKRDLQPETATTWSAGFDLAPTLLEGVRLGVTYFDISYRNQIVDGFGRGALYLNNPAQYPGLVAFQGTPAFAALRSLIENSGFTPATPINYAQADLALVDARRVNVGAVVANGLDVNLQYQLKTDTAGTFNIGLNATRFFEYRTAETGQPFIDRLNTISFPARFTARGQVGWSLGNLRTQVSANYVNSYRNTNSALVPIVGDYTTVDFDISYLIGDQSDRNLRLAFNVRNLLDAEPPLVDMAGSYDPSKASALGRVAAITATTRF